MTRKRVEVGERMSAASGTFFAKFPHLRPGACTCNRPLSAGPPWHEGGCPSAGVRPPPAARVAFEVTDEEGATT